MLTSKASIISAMFREIGCLDLAPDCWVLGAGGGVFAGGVLGRDTATENPVTAGVEVWTAGAGPAAGLPALDGRGGWLCLELSSRRTCCSRLISANSSSAARFAISRRFRRLRAFLDSFPPVKITVFQLLLGKKYLKKKERITSI